MRKKVGIEQGKGWAGKPYILCATLLVGRWHRDIYYILFDSYTQYYCLHLILLGEGLIVGQDGMSAILGAYMQCLTLGTLYIAVVAVRALLVLLGGLSWVACLDILACCM